MTLWRRPLARFILSSLLATALAGFGTERAHADDRQALCGDRAEPIEDAPAGAEAQLIVAGDGQLTFHGLLTTTHPIPGRRIRGDRYLARHLIVELDPTLVADDDTFLRVDLHPPTGASRVLACDLINPPPSGRTAYQFDLPTGLSPRSVLEVRLFRPVDPQRDDAEARRQYDRSIAAPTVTGHRTDAVF